DEASTDYNLDSGVSYWRTLGLANLPRRGFHVFYELIQCRPLSPLVLKASFQQY
ncbi:Hypothetical protein FKW44_011429, partial [Caligus rogercresseyi]